MNADEIRKMEAGRELDALVAEKVMGWKRREFPGQDPDSCWPDEYIFNLLVEKGLTHEDADGELVRVPHFSTDIAAAWEAVEKFALLPDVAVGLDCSKGIWQYMIHFHQEVRLYFDRAATAPLAICRAALLAVMGDE